MNVTTARRSRPRPAHAGEAPGRGRPEPDDPRGTTPGTPPAEAGGAAPAARPGPAARTLIVLIRAYQRWISPALAPRCRFHPSCSVYAATAIERFGAARGSLMAAWRLLKCQPFHPGGIDHVPTRPGRE